MFRYTLLLACCLAFALAKPNSSEDGEQPEQEDQPQQEGQSEQEEQPPKEGQPPKGEQPPQGGKPPHGPPPQGPPRNGEHPPQGPPPQGPPPQGPPPHGERPPHGPPPHGERPPHGPPPHGGHPPHGPPPHDDKPKYQFEFEQLGRMAGLIERISHESNTDFVKAQGFWSVHAPTPRAIKDYESLMKILISHKLNTCLPEDYSTTTQDYFKRNTEAVNTCMAGWKLDATLQEDAKKLFDELKVLDDEAKAKLEACKTDESCVEDDLRKELTESIESSLTTMRQDKLIDMRFHADNTSFAAVGTVALCIMNDTSDLRSEIYTSTATMNACAAQYGLPPTPF